MTAMLKMLSLASLVIRFFDSQKNFYNPIVFSHFSFINIFSKNVHMFVIFYSNGHCIFGSNSDSSSLTICKFHVVVHICTALMYKIQANKNYMSLWSVTDRCFLIKKINRLCVSCLSIKEIKLHLKLADQLIEFMWY